MLRPYFLKYTPIHKLQSFVNHVMLDVIFKAPKIASAVFEANLVIPKYHNLITGVNDDYILNPLKQAYLISKNLNRKELKLLRKAVHNNNKIRELCNGEIEPVLYDKISEIDENLALAIKTFCNFLYDESINKAVFYNSFGNVDDYYKNLIQRSSICRCCGINKVLTKFHSHRSALDHYLPRKHFPFSSINFKNLIPICDTCNSKYKLAENPLFEVIDKGKATQHLNRSKAFYPFRRDIPDINIEIVFNTPYSPNVEPEDFDINITCIGFEEQISTWERMFGITENYKAECCSDEMRLHFEEQYVADINYGKSHEEYISMLNKNKYGDVNFLKIPFLESLAS